MTTSSGKRRITKDDIEFLSSLQEEMNTQPTVCQADPRFWAILSSEYVQALPGDDINRVVFHDENGGNPSMSFKDACRAAVKLAYMIGGDGYLEDYLDKFDLYLSDKGELVAYGDGEGVHARRKLIEDYAALRECLGVSFMTLKRGIHPNTLFLTKREAEEHIGRYGYNYLEPRAYAMTAVRSPQVERLYDVLHHVDFEALGESAGVSEG